jgi:hypothetical protein
MKYLTVDSDNKILGWNEDAPIEGCIKTDASVPEYAANTQSLYWEGSSIIARDDDQKIVRNAAEPMRLLRDKRDALLASSDWWASSDLVMSDERKAYRQALRDITVGLDTVDKVNAVIFPTQPS